MQANQIILVCTQANKISTDGARPPPEPKQAHCELDTQDAGTAGNVGNLLNK